MFRGRFKPAWNNLWLFGIHAWHGISLTSFKEEVAVVAAWRPLGSRDRLSFRLEVLSMFHMHSKRFRTGSLSIHGFVRMYMYVQGWRRHCRMHPSGIFSISTFTPRSNPKNSITQDSADFTQPKAPSHGSPHENLSSYSTRW
jgi:hypothetical protein